MRARLVPLLVLLGAFAGCGLWRRAYVRPRYYSIEVPPPAQRAGARPAELVLGVRSLASDSRYRDRILYRPGGSAVGYHEYDRWVETPAEMLTSALRRALDAAGVARVVDDRLMRRAPVVLEGRLTRFDEVQGKRQWAAECEVELVLKQADDDRVLLATRLAARRPAKKRTTPSFVEAMNAAVAELAAKAAEAVAKALAAHQATGVK